MLQNARVLSNKLIFERFPRRFPVTSFISCNNVHEFAGKMTAWLIVADKDCGDYLMCFISILIRFTKHTIHS
jgi:hypothetical protein